MTNEERIQALEQEVAELKRGLEARPTQIVQNISTVSTADFKKSLPDLQKQMRQSLGRYKQSAY